MRSHTSSSAERPPLLSEGAAVCRQECKVLCVYSLCFYYHSRLNHAALTPAYLLHSIEIKHKSVNVLFVLFFLRVKNNWKLKKKPSTFLHWLIFVAWPVTSGILFSVAVFVVVHVEAGCAAAVLSGVCLSETLFTNVKIVFQHMFVCISA